MIPSFARFASVAITGFALVGCGSGSGDSTGVTPLVATSVDFRTEPLPTVPAAQPLGSISVSLLTADGRIAAGTNYTVTISLSTADTAAHLTGTTTLETTSGIATFSDLAVGHAGTDYRLVAHVDLASYSAASEPFSVTTGPPAQLHFDDLSSQPRTSRSISAGTAFSAVVRVTDAGGNAVTDATTPITLGYTRTPYGFTVAPDGIFGTTTVAAVNGVATFSGLSFHKTGLYSLTAVAAGLSEGTSSPLTIDAMPMTKLVFVNQPASATAGSPLGSFSVQQVDDYGNGLTLPPGPSYNVTLAIGNNPTGASLGGTLTESAAGVVAVPFGDITINKPGTGYTLVATSDGRTSVTSAPFNIQ